MYDNTFTRQGLRAVRIDETVAGNVTTTYVGNAEPGAEDAHAQWQIQKIVETVTGSNTITVITFPNKSNRYGFKWTERGTYTYA